MPLQYVFRYAYIHLGYINEWSKPTGDSKKMKGHVVKDRLHSLLKEAALINLQLFGI
jgi:hypothetical protein